MQSINLQPLTANDFSPFGDVIQTDAAVPFPINNNTFERYHALGKVTLTPTPESFPIISIFRCSEATSLPYAIKLMEQHPLGSQAIIPWSNIPFIVVVAKNAEAVMQGNIRAFKSDGRQGINLSAGIWHMPLIAPQAGLEFIVVDREGAGKNLEELVLNPPLLILPMDSDQDKDSKRNRA
ncbi:MAG: ureidoglycolate lyase [Pseudomonadales bacterium]|nr:ureidoglycolate lyase [Pseudomonadales bacterium]